MAPSSKIYNSLLILEFNELKDLQKELNRKLISIDSLGNRASRHDQRDGLVGIVGCHHRGSGQGQHGGAEDL